ncbi:MAG: bifunctional DNA primase/polymerase [Gemmatimonadota bacterium]
MTRLRDAALRYASHGWLVFPVVPRGKEPLTPNGFLDATMDPATIAEWWSRWPAANIGFPPGRAGLIVLDVDSPEGGEELRRLGVLAEPTMIVKTARGSHFYFQHPGGTIGNRKLRGLVDVRADRGFVLLPPSFHPSGKRYQALGKIEEIRPLPPAVAALLRRPDPAPRTTPPTTPAVDAGTPRRRAYVIAAIESECLELANSPEGDRNNALNRAAWSLSRFVATGEADAGKLVDLLTFAARNTGLEDDEIGKTIESAFGARGIEVPA